MKILKSLVLSSIFLAVSAIISNGQDRLTIPESKEIIPGKNIVAVSIENQTAERIKVQFIISLTQEFNRVGPVQYTVQSAAVLKSETGTVLKLIGQPATIKTGLWKRELPNELFSARPRIILPVEAGAEVLKVSVVGLSPEGDEPFTIILPLRNADNSTVGGKIVF